jgi:hypothetical protein
MFSSVVSCFFEANDGLRKQLHPHNCDCRQCVYVYACVSALKHVESTGTCVEPAIPKAASSHYELNEFQRKSKSYARSVCIVCTDLGHFGHLYNFRWRHVLAQERWYSKQKAVANSLDSVCQCNALASSLCPSKWLSKLFCLAAMGFLFGYRACRLGTRSLFARGLFYITCVTSQMLFEPRIPDWFHFVLRCDIIYKPSQFHGENIVRLVIQSCSLHTFIRFGTPQTTSETNIHVSFFSLLSQQLLQIIQELQRCQALI